MTPRQQEAALLAAQRLTYAEIARRMGIKRVTAISHIKALAARLPGDGTKPMSRVQEWMWTRQHAA
jgi:DNA-binding CsgD family transcriptional regulator